MPATKPYRMLDAKTTEKFFPEEDAPLIAPNFKAMGASLDMLFAMREEPYTMMTFVQDLANGNISRSNVVMRRHFVMRSMEVQNGTSVSLDEFSDALHDQLMHGAVRLKELSELDDEVRAELRLDLVMS